MVVRRSPAIVLSLVLSAAALGIAPGAVASDGGTAKDSDSCNGPSSYRLRVSLVDDNSTRLSVTAAVFSDDNDYWSWKLRHDGDLSALGEARAHDDDGSSFRIVRTMINFAGTDTVAFRAENERTGEVCRGEVDF